MKIKLAFFLIVLFFYHNLFSVNLNSNKLPISVWSLVGMSFIIVLIILLLFIIIQTYKLIQKYKAQNKYLKIGFEITKTSLWKYDIKKDCFRFNNSLSPFNLKNLSESIKLIHKEDQLKFKDAFNLLLQKKVNHISINFRYLDSSLLGSDFRFSCWDMIFYSDLDNEDVIIGIQKEISDQQSFLTESQVQNEKYELLLKNTQENLIYISPTFEVIWKNILNDHIANQFFKRCFDKECCVENKIERNELCRECALIKSLESNEIEIKQYDYEKTSLVVTAIPIFNRDNYRLGTLLKIVDNTQNNLSIQELKLAKEKAENSDKLKSAFVANMSHEIRTPLNAIVGFSELLVKSKNDEEKERFSEYIHTNCDLLLKLITDILDLSKIEAGSIELSPEQFDLVPFFQNQISSFQLRNPSQNISLICESKYKSCVINLDRSRLAQILANFLTNAFKFTLNGQIRVIYYIENDSLILKVSDTGIGIPREDIDKIFNRFHKQNDFKQGTGLGLSICKAIVEAQGGQIGVQSEKHKGTNIWVKIPCKIESIIPLSQFSDKENLSFNRISALENNKKSYFGNILIAEDNDSNFLLLNTILNKKYNVSRAINGVEVLNLLSKEDFTMILMDLKMPIMDGLEATKKIRVFNREIPIIALTANAYDSDRIAALNAGCDAFLTKPINWILLYETIDLWSSKKSSGIYPVVVEDDKLI